ncbi:MAG TPA: hypothetical protein DDW77_07685 [Verrucomicrobiales bacterium]|nr:hypothetical protein [Verrucomicrobiales bacterium]
MIQLQPSMVLEAIFNLIGAIFLNEMDLLAVRRLSNLRRCTLVGQKALPCVRRTSECDGVFVEKAGSVVYLRPFA